MITRRSFLLTATTAATAAAAAGLGAAAGAPLKRIGVQAGSLRAALTRDLAGTLEQIAAIGFREIELQWYGGNFGRTPEQLRTALDRAGLRATSALIHTGAMLVGWERHLASAKAIGIEHLAIVNITEDERQSLADCHEWADRFNRAGEIARKAGMWVALHNEPQFMTPVEGPGGGGNASGAGSASAGSGEAREGRTFYDEFITRTDPALVTLELDVGNMTRAGYDPVSYLRKYPARYRLFHLKDVPPQGQEGDRPLGKGRVDFQRILSAVPDRDAAHFFVEHAVDPAAPIDTMRQSYQHLASLS
jgi:sugar phosphate isomerase/epimerase